MSAKTGKKFFNTQIHLVQSLHLSPVEIPKCFGNLSSYYLPCHVLRSSMAGAMQSYIENSTLTFSSHL